jgi:hypothetical protein
MNLPYDPAYDQCGSSCGPERAGTTWYSEPVFMCPRCYANVLGAPPEPGMTVTLAHVADSLTRVRGRVA